MQNPRRYGASPYTIAVIHGGPGAPGSVAPVARALADRWGVLEPLQTADSVTGQVAELAQALTNHAAVPATLVGHSWGALLSYLVAAHHPALVRKVVLIGCPPFTAADAAGIEATRLARLTPAERDRAAELQRALADPAVPDRDATLAELGHLFGRTDAYDPIDHEDHAGAASDALPVDGDIFTRVWGEASALRASGELLALAERVRCPVAAIHGDYDPHPAAGVAGPLGGALADFHLVLLRRCGHEPWTERHARDAFYRALRHELR
jgi:pimeloyl-ACP methyl ester carboxylesterase